MSERIDHAAIAREQLRTAAPWLSSAGRSDLGQVANILAAQGHATLALVEQQRIANLIALAAGGHGGPTGFEHEAMDALGVLGTPHHLRLGPDIAAALKIGDDDE